MQEASIDAECEVACHFLTPNGSFLAFLTASLVHLLIQEICTSALLAVVPVLHHQAVFLRLQSLLFLFPFLLVLSLVLVGLDQQDLVVKQLDHAFIFFAFLTSGGLFVNQDD